MEEQQIKEGIKAIYLDWLERPRKDPDQEVEELSSEITRFVQGVYAKERTT